MCKAVKRCSSLEWGCLKWCGMRGWHYWWVIWWGVFIRIPSQRWISLCQLFKYFIELSCQKATRVWVRKPLPSSSREYRKLDSETPLRFDTAPDTSCPKLSRSSIQITWSLIPSFWRQSTLNYEYLSVEIIMSSSSTFLDLVVLDLPSTCIRTHPWLGIRMRHHGPQHIVFFFSFARRRGLDKQFQYYFTQL